MCRRISREAPSQPVITAQISSSMLSCKSALFFRFGRTPEMVWRELLPVVGAAAFLWILIYVILVFQKVCRENKYIFLNGRLDRNEEYVALFCPASRVVNICIKRRSAFLISGSSLKGSGRNLVCSLCKPRAPIFRE